MYGCPSTVVLSYPSLRAEAPFTTQRRPALSTSPVGSNKQPAVQDIPHIDYNAHEGTADTLPPIGAGFTTP